MTATADLLSQTAMPTESPLRPGFHELDDAIHEIVKRTGMPLKFSRVKLEVSNVQELARAILDSKEAMPLIQMEYEIGQQLTALCDQEFCSTSWYSPKIREVGGTIADSMQNFLDKL